MCLLSSVTSGLLDPVNAELDALEQVHDWRNKDMICKFDEWRELLVACRGGSALNSAGVEEHHQ